MYALIAAPVSLISISFIRIFATRSAMRGIFILEGLFITFKYNFGTNFTKPLFLEIHFFLFENITAIISGK